MRVFRRLARALREGESCVLVTVLKVQGSTPRGPGSRMLVTADRTIGSIGGGTLEYRAIGIARVDPQQRARVEVRQMTLGPQLGQCCGGVVDLLFERKTPSEMPIPWLETVLGQLPRGATLQTELDLVSTSVSREVVSGVTSFSPTEDGSTNGVSGALPRLVETDGSWILVESLGQGELNVVLFGAGHVGKALANVLSACDCSLMWVDSRSSEFPITLPDNARAIVVDEAYDQTADIIAQASPDTVFLVMTHSHPIDYSICRRILDKDDFRFLGLIGSATKRGRFRSHLIEDGIAPEVVARLKCPIGITGIEGKLPGEIAVATAAELLRLEPTTETFQSISSVTNLADEGGSPDG
jgi:xanthine dehydrogenase accessory factor